MLGVGEKEIFSDHHSDIGGSFLGFVLSPRHIYVPTTQERDLSDLTFVSRLTTIRTASAEQHRDQTDRQVVFWPLSPASFCFATKIPPSIFQAGNTWISVSYFLLDLIAGVTMFIILALLLLFRRSELIQVDTRENITVVYLPGFI